MHVHGSVGIRVRTSEGRRDRACSYPVRGVVNWLLRDWLGAQRALVLILATTLHLVDLRRLGGGREIIVTAWAV